MANRDIVVVGTSAGGVEALTAELMNLALDENLRRALASAQRANRK